MTEVPGVDLPSFVRERLTELLGEPRRLLVAVSGGSDSVALLRALAETDLDVIVGHLDHGLREESREDARFVAELCDSLGIELVSERIDVAQVAGRRGWNLEEAARKVRYQFLTREARRLGAVAVVTAHTLDDQAETVLMQLLRGAAYARGMEPVQRQVVRPLLELSRSNLERYLMDLGQPWREDASNRDRSRLRAWLRHEVIPALEERFPHSKRSLSRHARVQGAVEEYLRSEAGRLENGGAFDLARLGRAHPAVQRQAIALLFEEAGVAADFERVEEVRSRLATGSEQPYRLSLAPGLWVRLAYGRMELAREESPLESRPVTSAKQLPEGVHPAVLELPDLELRSRRPGDRLRLGGGTRKLADVLIDRKVPREERDGVKVLASGSRVLWAEGIGPAVDVDGEDADIGFMRWALEQAHAAEAAGELPVGAVVVRDGEVVGEGHNRTQELNDPSAHAEILAMREAARSIGDWRLTECTLYVTLEPCPMCAGAGLEAHLGRIVFGAPNRRDGALGSVTDLLRAPWKRTLDVRSGVLAAEAARLLSAFFEGRRR